MSPGVYWKYQFIFNIDPTEREPQQWLTQDCISHIASTSGSSSKSLCLR
jgi:hypothetical protein